MKQTTIEKLQQIQYPLIQVPFHGSPTIIKLRELTQAQISACGGNDFSLIETFEDKLNSKKKPTMEQIINFADLQSKIAKRSMVCPTYDEVFKMCSGNIDIEKTKNELKELDMIIATIPNDLERKQAELKYNNLRVFYDLLLPEDFLATITSYALGIEKSDIKEVTKESLISAATMAKMGNDNPSDHLQGIFTDFMKEDINKRAWIMFQEKNKSR